MIHYTPESSSPGIGLNITIGTWRKPWFSLRWVWYTPKTRNMTSRRIRIRLYMRPFILTSKDTYNVVHGYLWERNAVVVNVDQFRDICSDAGVQTETYIYTEA
jgi:hypothetical protein